MREQIISRNDIFKYAKENFDTEPEYLWQKYPDYTVLRHKGNSKWYGIVMNIQKDKLGLTTKDKIDILDVKCDPAMIGSLLGTVGYLPAYHMNKDHWITVLLDGSVPRHEIFKLLDLSFELTQK